ncbi:shikimate dehydrogenase [Candidatus Magnetomonas plexicatena]|uniref:shikimate dehydrogenase n=1 Tax=Candidatus Magnetomonas plexicatena TaxID=2552947 RepID=UPI001102ABE0|nr:shikimate dehydrogenase [Nitrospirales bacterium LBB_01]
MITAKTKITGLIGYPVGHSLSPYMHNAAYEHLGLDFCYVCFPVHPDNLTEAVRGVRAMDFAGANVTVPHKEHAMAALDEIDEEARFIGAVNTIVNSGGKLTGYNTDGRGFMRSLAEAGISLKGKKVFVVGAGGASKAITYYIAKEAASLSIFDIDEPKLTALTTHLKTVNPNVFAEKQNCDAIKNHDVIINATPLGLKSDDPAPFDISLISASHTVIDVIYKDTPLIKKAKTLHCPTTNGLGMLFWQGVLAFELWTQTTAPVEIMRKALLVVYEKTVV